MAKPHRVQAMLDDALYQRLVEVATDEGTTVSELIRRAVAITYLEDWRRTRRLRALEDLMALEAPVSDWPEMKADILRGALGD